MKIKSKKLLNNFIFFQFLTLPLLSLFGFANVNLSEIENHTNIENNLSVNHSSSIPTSIEELRQTDSNVIANWSKYDGRDYNIVPNVKDQGSTNLCWAYSVNNVAEISVLRKGITPNATKDNISFDPKLLGYSVFRRGPDPLNKIGWVQYNGNWTTSPGNVFYPLDPLIQWAAPIPSGVNAKPESWYEHSAYKLIDAKEYNYSHSNVNTIPIIKKAIATHGAIATGISYTGNSHEFYNPKYAPSNAIGHAVTFIGWDDTIPKEKFWPKQASVDGAWIVKNSYLDDQFFYVSYESTFKQFMTLDFASKDEYMYNYFYDNWGSKHENNLGGNTIKSNSKVVANIFQAKKGTPSESEIIKAVNVHLPQEKTNLKVKIYTDLTEQSNPYSGVLAYEQDAFFEESGYRTIKLNKHIKIQKDSYFAIVVDVSPTPDAAVTRASMKGTKSFELSEYGSWNVLRTGVLRIKAFTSTVPNDTSTITNDISDKTLTNITIPSTNHVYNGLAIIPTPIVNYNNNILILNKDYNLTYSNNTYPGQATITVTGIGEYSGSQTINFTIEKGDKPPINLNSITVVKDSKLNQYSSALPTNWIWENSNLILDGLITKVNAKYDGNDNNYYKNIIHNINVVYEDVPIVIDPTKDELKNEINRINNVVFSLINSKMTQDELDKINNINILDKLNNNWKESGFNYSVETNDFIKDKENKVIKFKIKVSKNNQSLLTNLISLTYTLNDLDNIDQEINKEIQNINNTDFVLLNPNMTSDQIDEINGDNLLEFIGLSKNENLEYEIVDFDKTTIGIIKFKIKITNSLNSTSFTTEEKEIKYIFNDSNISGNSRTIIISLSVVLGLMVVAVIVTINVVLWKRIKK